MAPEGERTGSPRQLISCWGLPRKSLSSLRGWAATHDHSCYKLLGQLVKNLSISLIEIADAGLEFQERKLSTTYRNHSESGFAPGRRFLKNAICPV